MKYRLSYYNPYDYKKNFFASLLKKLANVTVANIVPLTDQESIILKNIMEPKLLLIVLLLIISFAHIVQVFQVVKKMEAERMPVFIFGLVYLGLALWLLLNVPYILRIWLGFALIWGVGQGNQIMRLDHGWCVNRLIVILTLVIIAGFGWMLVVG